MCSAGAWQSQTQCTRLAERGIKRLNNNVSVCVNHIQSLSLSLHNMFLISGSLQPQLLAGGQSFTARTSSERLFRGDVCRLGKCPDFRVSITTSNDVDVEDEVIGALMALDRKCRSWNSDELTRAIKSTELPFGWKVQACTCRDNAVWIDPNEKIEVNVSRIFEVTGVSKPDEQSEDQSFELRLSSEELSEAVQSKDDGAWNHMEALLSTVQMLHDSLRLEMGC